jgi:hypothetical protein
MITFSNLGKLGMNLGNQLFQIAALTGFSEKYNCEFVLPEWKYARYFQHPPIQGNVHGDIFIEEEGYHYTPGYWDKYANDFRTMNVDIHGWLQSEKYWQFCKAKVFSTFSFKEELSQEVKSKFKAVFTKKTIAISIRRGDFITNPNFYLLPLDYYLGALATFFPAWRDSNIIVFSDDLKYCKMHIRSLPNIYFAIGLKDIEQLCLMSMCDHFIISNSSFSWWGAMLGEKKDSIIVRSPYQLDGDFLKTFNTKDYYPERWSVYDHIHKNVDIANLLASKSRLRYYAAQNYYYGKFKRIKKKIKMYL